MSDLSIDTLTVETTLNAPTSATTATDIATAISNHAAAADPHPTYTTATEVATAIAGKENTIAAGTTSQYWRGDKTFQTLDKAAVGLANVDNTSDANKPVSTATQTALNLKYDASNPNGYETPAQLNTRDTNNRNRANHTGTQLKATISDFAHTHPLSELQQSGATTGQVPAWNGTAWVPQAQASGTYLILNANVTNASNVTLVNLPTLGFAVTAGRTYTYRIFLIYQSTATTNGLAVTASVPAGTTTAVARIMALADATVALFSGNITSSGDVVTAASAPATGANAAAIIEGVFICTTTGTFTPQFRSEVNGQTTTIVAGSNTFFKDIT